MSGVCEKTELDRASRGGFRYDILYEKLVSYDNIWQAYKNFVGGKWRRPAVQRFWLNLEKELRLLYHELNNGRYRHGQYHHFVVNDPKRRDVYVATVRDKVVHQILAQFLEKKFGPSFYYHSYAARVGKGIDVARNYVFKIIRKIGGHHQVFVGKLDVQKYFSNINHQILFKLLERRISDVRILELCQKIIEGFGENGRSLPLGNLTSQWFANIYLHEADYYAKHILNIPYYLRYNDDMIIIDRDAVKIKSWSDSLQKFCHDNLALTIPSCKITLTGLPQSVDILGLVTNGLRIWSRLATVRRARAHLAVKFTTLEPELLDTLSSYNGCGIVQIFSFF